MEEIVIRLLKEDDIQQINDLYHRAYGVVRSNEKFRWEFLEGPAGPSIYVVAVDPATNKVVGTQCAIPLYVVNAAGARILTAKSEDTLVDVGYRGRSIFEKMYELLFDECRKAGIVSVWGFTYAVKPFRKLGFDIPFACNFGLIAFNANAFTYLNSLKEKRPASEKLKIAALVVASRIKYLFHLGGQSLKAYKIIKGVQETLEELTPLSAGAFSLQLDLKFMGWRLRSNPYPNNHLYYSLVDASNRQVASVICSHSKNVSYIMHMAFDSKIDHSTKQRFLNAAIKDLSGKTDIVRFWGFTHNDTGNSEIELLKGSGFIFTNQGISFVWKKLGETGSLDVKDFVLSRMASQGT